MTKAVNLKYVKIRAKQKLLTEQLCQLQMECEHENVSHEYKADTGNYSKSDDAYWIEHRCPDCAKFWTTDQKTLKMK